MRVGGRLSAEFILERGVLLGSVLQSSSYWSWTLYLES